MSKIQTLRGMNDIDPQQSREWSYVERVLRTVVESYGYEEIRLIAFINNCNKKDLKFIYEDTVRDVEDGTLYYFNANKRHSVFSTAEDIIMCVFCLKFDEELFKTLIEQYRFA